MNRTPRSVEEALRRSRVFRGEYTRADLEDARHDLARELHELRRVRFPHTAAQCGHLAPAHPAAPHERAAYDLLLLCRGTVHHDSAARHVSAFDTDRDPDGALTFACLLYLADEEEGAQFWWRYTAGAGSVTAGLCLYLLHLRRGDLRDARHWAGQISRLDSLAWSTYTPVPHQARTDTDASGFPGVRYSLPAPAPAVSERAVRDAVDDLETPSAAGLGPVPQPIPELAASWEELTTA
ncbi:hypothetical protein ABZ848_27115 [Streptomyces sp. NPDC047081]|uniref:hypothetical protein n=1 Tax=Streptomyces sp. NPDC047081 TaxID=3154706 RepID=UPI0033E46AED